MNYDRNYYESLPLGQLLLHLERVPNKSELMIALESIMRDNAGEVSELKQDIKNLTNDIADEEQLKGELETELRNLKEKFTQLKDTCEDQKSVITEIDHIFENLNKEKGI